MNRRAAIGAAGASGVAFLIGGIRPSAGGLFDELIFSVVVGHGYWVSGPTWPESKRGSRKSRMRRFRRGASN